MKLGEIVNYCSTENVSLFGSVTIQSVCNDFGERAESVVFTSHIFPQCVLTLYYLGRRWAEVEGPRLEPCVNQSFPPAQWP